MIPDGYIADVMEMAGVTLCGPRGSGPRRQLGGDRGLVLSHGRETWPASPHSDILHAGWGGWGGLLVTISRWTFNIAQIPLHMWHFCFCVMCSSGSICFSLCLSLSGAQGWALATAQLSKAEMPTWKWPCVCGIGCLLSTSEVADTKATSSSAV